MLSTYQTHRLTAIYYVQNHANSHEYTQTDRDICQIRPRHVAMSCGTMNEATKRSIYAVNPLTSLYHQSNGSSGTKKQIHN